MRGFSLLSSSSPEFGASVGRALFDFMRSVSIVEEASPLLAPERCGCANGTDSTLLPLGEMALAGPAPKPDIVSNPPGKVVVGAAFAPDAGSGNAGFQYVLRFQNVRGPWIFQTVHVFARGKSPACTTWDRECHIVFYEAFRVRNGSTGHFGPALTFPGKNPGSSPKNAGGQYLPSTPRGQMDTHAFIMKTETPGCEICELEVEVVAWVNEGATPPILPNGKSVLDDSVAGVMLKHLVEGNCCPPTPEPIGAAPFYFVLSAEAPEFEYKYSWRWSICPCRGSGDGSPPRDPDPSVPPGPLGPGSPPVTPGSGDPPPPPTPGPITPGSGDPPPPPTPGSITPGSGRHHHSTPVVARPGGHLAPGLGRSILAAGDFGPEAQTAFGVTPSGLPGVHRSSGSRS